MLWTVVLVAVAACLAWHAYQGLRTTYVRDRATGQLVPEPVPFAVRLQLYLLFGTAPGRWVAAQPFLRSYQLALSARKQQKFDDSSQPHVVAQQIADFISAYGIDTRDVAGDINSRADFPTLNAFFYRRLKPETRPLPVPLAPDTVVSPADCRALVFDTATAAQHLWIKGTRFTVDSLLLGDADGGASAADGETADRRRLCAALLPEASAPGKAPALMSCRLAPTDYHRFHAPVDGVVRAVWSLGADLYSVKPIATRSSVDVFTRNRRTVLLLQQSDQCGGGVMAYVMVGATEVGSIQLSVRVGQRVQRGDEIGWFAYGGSQLVLLFPPRRISNGNGSGSESWAPSIAWSPDLRAESARPGETLVRVRSAIGTATATAAAAVVNAGEDKAFN